MTTTRSASSATASHDETEDSDYDWTGNHVADMDFPARIHEVQFPSELNDRKQWMGALPGDKKSFAPWGDRNPPVECKTDDCPADQVDDPECDCDGRFKWSHEGHYVTGREIDCTIGTSRIAHRSFIFKGDDPFLFVDLDNIRCPETGAVHPAAIAFLAHHPPTWTEVSVSSGGLHAVYCGELPGDMVQATLQLDDKPWGAHADSNDYDDDNRLELPVIELYDTARKVAVLTGATVPGAPNKINECNAGVLETMLEAHRELPARSGADRLGVPGVFDGDDDANDESGASGSSETPKTKVTDDMEEVFDAINELDAQRVAKHTIVEEWIDSPSTDYRAFVPTWAPNGYNGTAVYCTEDKFVDTGHRDGWGGPVIMAAIDLNIISDRGAEPGDVDGEDFQQCVEHLIDLGFDVPRYVPSGNSTTLYIEVLGEYAPEWGDPYTDMDACLVAALRARDNGTVPADADPPTLALKSIIDHMWAVSPDSHAVDEGVRERARELFDSVSEERVVDRFNFAVSEGDCA